MTRHKLVGEWWWEYDHEDDTMPSSMIWAGPRTLPPPVAHWCRWPSCDEDTFGEFCANHAAVVPPGGQQQ